MYWADRQGLDKVLAGMEQLEARYGEDYAVAPLLRRLAAEGRTFAEA
jgi:3-hydroxyacyl-CoA dehydrogenase